MDINTLRYTFVSDACFKQTGFTKEEYLEKTLLDDMTPESSVKTKRILNNILSKPIKDNKTKLESTFEVQKFSRNGSLH